MKNPISRVFGLFTQMFQGGLDRIEDPTSALERAYEQQFRALEETRRGRLDIETAAARLEIEARRTDEVAVTYEGQARRAIAAGRNDLARLALSRRDELLEQAARTAKEREHLEEERLRLQQQESSLTGALQAFRGRKEVLKAQYGATRARLRVGEALTGYSRTVTSVGADVRRFEGRLLTLQARARALETVAASQTVMGLNGPLIIDQELAVFGAEPRIEQELDRLRAELLARLELSTNGGAHQLEAPS